MLIPLFFFLRGGGMAMNWSYGCDTGAGREVQVPVGGYSAMTSRGSQVANPISGNSCAVAEAPALPFAGFGSCGESRQQRSLSHDSIRLSLRSEFDIGDHGLHQQFPAKSGGVLRG